MPRKKKTEPSKPKIPDNLITQVDFARMCEISRGNVQYLIKNKRLDLVGKRIDLEGKLTKETLKNYADNGKRSWSPKQKEESIKKQVKTIPKEIKSLQQITLANIESIPKAEIDKMTKLVSALKMQQDIMSSSGKLIDKDFNTVVWYKIYTLIKSELYTLGEKLTPLILADCGIDSTNSDLSVKIKKRITDSVYKAVKNFKVIAKDQINGLANGSD